MDVNDCILPSPTRTTLSYWFDRNSSSRKLSVFMSLRISRELSTRTKSIISIIPLWNVAFLHEFCQRKTFLVAHFVDPNQNNAKATSSRCQCQSTKSTTEEFHIVHEDLSNMLGKKKCQKKSPLQAKNPTVAIVTWCK